MVSEVLNPNKVQWSGSRRPDRTNLLWVQVAPRGAALIAAKSLLQRAREGVWQVPIPCSAISLVASFPQGCFCVSPALEHCVAEVSLLPHCCLALPFLIPRSQPASWSPSSCLTPKMFHRPVATPIYTDEAWPNRSIHHPSPYGNWGEQRVFPQLLPCSHCSSSPGGSPLRAAEGETVMD